MYVTSFISILRTYTAFSVDEKIWKKSLKKIIDLNLTSKRPKKKKVHLRHQILKKSLSSTYIVRIDQIKTHIRNSILKKNGTS